VARGGAVKKIGGAASAKGWAVTNDLVPGVHGTWCEWRWMWWWKMVVAMGAAGVSP